MATNTTAAGPARRVVLVTGATGNIGRVLVARLSRDEDLRVVATDRDDDLLDVLARSVDAPVATIQADLADASAPVDLVREVVERHGSLDCLVNNAAVTEGSALLDTSTATYDLTMAVNVRAPFLLAQAAIPEMITRGSGIIVNVASVLGSVAMAGHAAYCLSKGALLQLTRVVTVEHAKDGIRCNAVCPGTIVGSELSEALDRRPDGQALLDHFASLHPVGRLGRPEEVADVVHFCLSDAAAFMHGSAIGVDGGYLAW